jgi:hypothetical protein
MQGGFQQGRGGHMQGGNRPSGKPPREQKPLSQTQEAWCISKGVCFRCLQHPTFASFASTSDDGKHHKIGRGWACDNQEAPWPPRNLPSFIDTTNMPRVE